MKNLNTLILLAIMLGSSAFGYSQQKIKESTESIGDLKGNALTVIIMHADKKDIFKEWKSIMKSYGGSVKMKGDKIYTTDARIESISSGNVQINAELGKEKNNEQKFTVIFQSERGAVSSKHDAYGFTTANMILQNFAKELSVKATSDHHNSEQKRLSDLQKEKSDLEKENERLTKKIKKYNEDIIDAKETIEKNNKTLLSNTEQIEQQKKVVSDSDKQLRSIK